MGFQGTSRAARQDVRSTLAARGAAVAALDSFNA